jgi:predicted ATP-binding protein involved in virulence
LAQATTGKKLRPRVFAGPNGSGKSTVIKFVRKQKIDSRNIDFGYYVSADDIAVALTKKGIGFNKYGIKTTPKEIIEIALDSGLVNKEFNKNEFLQSFKLRANRLALNSIERKEFLSQIIADFLRKKLLSDTSHFWINKN